MWIYFPDHRKLLAFSWHFGTNCVRYFQFTVLPFGLSSAPFIFTKLIKPLEEFWRLRLCRPVDSAGIDYSCALRWLYESPGGAGLLFRSELTIHMPPGDLHGVYAPPGGARLLIRPELRICVPPGGFHDVLHAPPSGAGLLFRPEFDDSCAPPWLT